MTTYFERCGRHNTEETLQRAMQAAVELDIEHIIVASTSGKTGLRAVELARDKEIKVVIVTHNRGFSESEIPDYDENIMDRAVSMGAIVHHGTMVTRGLGRAIRKKTGYSHEDLIAHTLRILGEGTKVCVEITAMAYDAGLIPNSYIVAVGGTSRGADTACIIEPRPSNLFFDIRIREFITKPRNTRYGK